MHEFSVAKSIVDTIIQVAEANKAVRVLEVNLELGEVSLVNIDQLNFHIEMLVENTIAEGMKVNATEKSVKIQCPECGYVGPVQYEEKNPEWHIRVPIFKCLECGSPDTVIVEGRELNIKDINVSYGEEEEDA